MCAVKPDKFIDMFNLYIKINQKNTDKAIAAMYADYEPLDNNAVYTEINETNSTSGTPSTVTSLTSETAFDSDTLKDTTKNIVSGTTTSSESEHNYSEYKHGNISATTNQSIIGQEYELRHKNYCLDLIKKAVYFGGVYYAN